MVQVDGAKRSDVSTRSESKLKKQRLTWEVKKNLVRNRLKILEQKLGEYDKKGERAPMMPRPSQLKTSDPPSCNNGVKTSTMERAEEIQTKLSSNFPSFFKLMLKSHVSGGFWLGLPSKYCKAHLPEHDVTMVLADENGQEYEARYLAAKSGLSGGWRGFSIAHELLDGDVLVFQLIEQYKFKIYIVRARTLKEVDAATGLQNLTDQPEPIATVKREEQSEEDPMMCEPENENHWEPVTVDPHQREGTMDAYEPLNVHVDGLVLDSELPVQLREKYYNLCCSQNSVLHENLVKGLNSKLAAGMISETVSIADAIRAIKPTASATNHLESWDRTLKAFEDLGMGVGFIRARVQKLLGLPRKSHSAMIELRKTERAAVEVEIRDLRMKLLNAEAAMRSLDAEIEALNAENEKIELAFKEATAPW